MPEVTVPGAEVTVPGVEVGNGTEGADETLAGGGGWGRTPVGTAMHSMMAVVLSPTTVNSVGVGTGM